MTVLVVAWRSDSGLVMGDGYVLPGWSIPPPWFRRCCSTARPTDTGRDAEEVRGKVEAFIDQPRRAQQAAKEFGAVVCLSPERGGAGLGSPAVCKKRRQAPGISSGACRHQAMQEGLFQFFQDALHVAGDDAPEYLLANQHDGRQAAGSHAAQAGEGVFAVRRSLADIDAQEAAELVEHFLRPPHVARGAHAHGDGVLALGGHGEEGVEGDYPIDFGYGDAEPPCHDALHLGGQVAEEVLRLVQDVDELAGAVAVLVADGEQLVYFVLRYFDFAHGVEFMGSCYFLK